MAIRNIVGYLSEKDRRRYVDVHARVHYVMSGNPSVTLEQAIQTVHADQNLYRELREKYEIAGDEAVSFALYDGAILESDSGTDE